MKYIIRLKYSGYNSAEYISGGSFVYQGEKYACITNVFKDAKRYSSYKVAVNARNKLFSSCTNVPSEYEILEVNE